MMQKKRLIIAMTGATGAIYGVRMLQVLRAQKEWETHFVISDAGAVNLKHEMGMKRAELAALADVTHGINDYCAVFDENTGSGCPRFWRQSYFTSG
jgi:flavin prenyltransferase